MTNYPIVSICVPTFNAKKFGEELGVSTLPPFSYAILAKKTIIFSSVLYKKKMTVRELEFMMRIWIKGWMIGDFG